MRLEPVDRLVFSLIAAAIVRGLAQLFLVFRLAGHYGRRRRPLLILEMRPKR